MWKRNIDVSKQDAAEGDLRYKRIRDEMIM